MQRAGYTANAIALTLDRDKRTVRKALSDSLMEFRSAPLMVDGSETPETREAQYLKWHAQATAVAAAMGNAQPAMDMLDRLGVVPETSRDRTMLQVSRERGEAQRAIANTYAAGGNSIGKGGATVNIGIGFPAQLTGVSQATEPGSMQVSLALENQQLTDTLCDTKLVGPGKL